MEDDDYDYEDRSLGSTTFLVHHRYIEQTRTQDTDALVPFWIPLRTRIASDKVVVTELPSNLSNRHR